MEVWLRTHKQWLTVVCKYSGRQFISLEDKYLDLQQHAMIRVTIYSEQYNRDMNT